jgi:hypothetical protein
MRNLEMKQMSGYPFSSTLFSHTTGLDEHRPSNRPGPSPLGVRLAAVEQGFRG